MHTRTYASRRDRHGHSEAADLLIESKVLNELTVLTIGPDFPDNENRSRGLHGNRAAPILFRLVLSGGESFHEGEPNMRSSRP